MARIFITGAVGFLGAHLAPALSALGHEVVAAQTDLDVRDRSSVASALAAAAPELVVHFAAIAHAPTCERDPATAEAVNVGGTEAVIEAMRAHAPAARLLFPSTAHVYAPGPGLTEESAIAPGGVYAMTKWTCEQRIAAAGVPATVLRLFNHVHRTQSPDFILPRIYQALVAAAGETVEVEVGNVNVERDFGSLQDLLRAVTSVIGRGEAAAHEVFNVCSGVAKRIDATAHELARRLGKRLVLVTDQARVRDEATVVSGVHMRLTAATGWQPTSTTVPALIDAFLANV